MGPQRSSLGDTGLLLPSLSHDCGDAGGGILCLWGMTGSLVSQMLQGLVMAGGEPCWALQGERWTTWSAGKRRKEKYLWNSMLCLILLILMINSGETISKPGKLSLYLKTFPSGVLGTVTWEACTALQFRLFLSALRESRYPGQAHHTACRARAAGQSPRL